MKLLVLGGTRFVGRHIARTALSHGHELTLFHRGKTNPDLFPDVENILGDRETEIEKLAERSWDAVVDTCGYVPRIVGLSAHFLKEKVDQYLFISSISVYSDLSQPPNENSAVGKLEDDSEEEVTGESYGPLKALCENVVAEIYRDRACIVRPGLIAGPHDPTDRFTYWPVRMERGGKVLAPDCEVPVQYIDARDLAEWIVHSVEKGTYGTYNASGPPGGMPVKEFLERIRRAVNSAAAIQWVPGAILQEQKVEPWSDLPAILPYDGSLSNMARADVSKAIAAGLSFRSLEETAKDTLAYWHSVGKPPLKAGLSEEREKAVLASQ